MRYICCSRRRLTRTQRQKQTTTRVRSAAQTASEARKSDVGREGCEPILLLSCADQSHASTTTAPGRPLPPQAARSKAAESKKGSWKRIVSSPAGEVLEQSPCRPERSEAQLPRALMKPPRDDCRASRTPRAASKRHCFYQRKASANVAGPREILAPPQRPALPPAASALARIRSAIRCSKPRAPGA